MRKAGKTVEDDPERWDWKPAAPHHHRARALAALALAASCLTIGILIGILSISRWQKPDIVQKASLETPQSSATVKSPSEPTLALGSSSDTAAKPQGPGVQMPVAVLNKGAAEAQVEHARTDDKAPETSEPQEASPNVSAPRPAPRRREDIASEAPEKKHDPAKPARQPSSDRNFKNYSDLRNYVLRN
jgi:hypothetical protein